MVNVFSFGEYEFIKDFMKIDKSDLTILLPLPIRN